MYELLTGKHIILRKAKESDYRSMLKNVWSDPDVYEWMLFEPTFTEKEALERCRRSIEFQKDNFAYFVADKKTNTAFGFCGIKEKQPGHYDETGIGIGKDYQGRGYGKEIVSLLLDLTFNKLDGLVFRYDHFHDNIRSKKVAEYFGFVYDSSHELTRPWDGSLKQIDSCLLTRDKYLKNCRKSE